MIHSTIFPATQLVPRSTIVPIMICKDAMHASVKQAYTQAFTIVKRQATRRRVTRVANRHQATLYFYILKHTSTSQFNLLNTHP